MRQYQAIAICGMWWMAACGSDEGKSTPLTPSSMGGTFGGAGNAVGAGGSTAGGGITAATAGSSMASMDAGAQGGTAGGLGSSAMPTNSGGVATAGTSTGGSGMPVAGTSTDSMNMPVGGSGTAGDDASTAGEPGSEMMGMAGTDTAGMTGMTGTAGVGAMGSGGTDAMETAGTEDPPAAEFLRPCVTDGSQVVLIGDSYSNYDVAHRPLAEFLTERAQEAGALSTTDAYLDYSVAGTTLAAGSAEIPTQWQSAKRQLPIHAVVMTGGGNDVLIFNQDCRPEGSEMDPACQQVVMNSLDAVEGLLTDMEASGVTDVLYFWYPHIPGGLLTGFQSGASIADYTYPLLVSLAESASTETFHVHMIPTVDLFEGHPEYIYSDGLHANDAGEGVIADAIWEVMEENCIAQTGACCEAP